jgi:competence protein ComEA
VPALVQRLRQHLEPVGIAPAEALALVILLAGALALTAVVWVGSPPPPIAGDAGMAMGEGAASPDGVLGVTSSAPPATPTEPSSLVVHVAGQVRRPGVVTLAPGSRVGDAIAAVGGPTRDAVLDSLNLARPLGDGEQIVVPAPGEEVAPPPAGGPSGAIVGDPELLDLNAATAEELTALPGIGPVTAQRIVDHRDSIGGFVAITQLLEVPGIGPARFADLDARVRL